MAASVSTSASAAMRSRSRSAVRYDAIITAASVRTGTPAGQAWRSRARSSSRKVTRPTIATATDPNRVLSASVRLSATVPVPADSRRAAALGSIRAMLSSTNSARKASKSSKCRCRTPLAQPASAVTARLVSALGPSRSRIRSAASNSWLRASRRVRPGGRLAVFWHAFQLPSDMAEAFAAVYLRVVTDSPFNVDSTRQGVDAYQAVFTKAAGGIREVGGFSNPEQWRFDWEQIYTRDAWLDQLPTSGTLTWL